MTSYVRVTCIIETKKGKTTFITECLKITSNLVSNYRSLHDGNFTISWNPTCSLLAMLFGNFERNVSVFQLEALSCTRGRVLHFVYFTGSTFVYNSISQFLLVFLIWSLGVQRTIRSNLWLQRTKKILIIMNFFIFFFVNGSCEASCSTA